jgi:RHS repeat-associated protein
MRTIFLALLSVVCIISAGAQPAPAPEATLQALSWTDGVAYAYDGAGNIKRIGTDVQVYDAVSRLIRSDTNSIRRNYRYDAFGNRLACTDAIGSDCQYGRQVTSTRNQLSGATYDPAGNLTNSDGHTYSYDAFNMQTRDQVDGTAVVREYIYTANDERIAVYVPGAGSWQWSLRDASGKVLREMTSSDPPAGTGTVGTASWSWVKDYVYRDGLLVASRQLEPGAAAPTTYHYHVDHLGTPRQITDDSGRIVGAHSYHAFGPEQTDDRKDEPSPTRLKYTGHERDPELDYMHARYYDAKMGRFLSVDPVLDVKAALASPQRWNRYSYVSNNPINKIDPDGRDEWAMSQRMLAFEDDWHGRDKYQAAGLAAAGVVAGGIAAAPAIAGGGLARGAFSLAPIARGWAIEAALAAKFGGGLPRNFPTIDRFLNGVATSVKSMDLMSKTYQNTARLTSTLTGYIDKLAQFNGARLGGVRVEGGAITQRVLEVAVQAGAATPAQTAALQQAAAYAKEHDVVLKVITIR